MRAVYATAERVMRASDIKASAWVKDEIVDALESSADAVDRLVNLGDATRPGFAPWKGSITFDWPTPNNGNAYKFWLNQFRLHSLTTLTSGGDALTADTLPWPASGPPYSAVEIDTEADDTFDIGDTGTGQHSLVIDGIWGVFGEDRTRTAWTLGTTANSSTTTLNLSAPIGIGAIVTIGTERVIVEDRAWADSGQTASALTASVASQSITVSSGAAFLAGEDILADSERMLIRDIAGNVLTVQRAVSGSALAAHTLATPIYWARSCTVERGALGTTAAAHTAGDAVSIYRAPALAEQLCVAYAIDRRAQESAGYARTVGQGESERQVSARGIAQLEARMRERYGRIRHLAV